LKQPHKTVFDCLEVIALKTGSCGANALHLIGC